VSRDPFALSTQRRLVFHELVSSRTRLRLAAGVFLAGCQNLSALSGGTPDSGSLPDATSDARAPWCDRSDGGLGHAFCADFDEGQLPALWDTVSESSDGGATLDDTQSLSPPASFQAILPFSRGLPGTYRARVVKTFPEATKSIDVHFSIFADALPEAGLSPSFVTLTFDGFRFDLEARNSLPIVLGQYAVAADGTMAGLDAGIPTTTVLPAAWRTVDILVGIAPGTDPDTVTVTIDGQLAVRLDTPLAMKLTGSYSVAVGLQASDSNAETVHIDNVTIDSE
jgi:hypothetical protein